MHRACLPRLTPAHRPTVSIDVTHGLLRPVGLEDEIGFFSSEIALNNALLIDARDAVVLAQWGSEVLEDPLGRPSEPIQRFLRLEMPVEKVAGVGFRPVAIG